MIKKHGGNVHKFAREHKVDKKEIIDFSANINPLGISKEALNRFNEVFEDVLNYPDPEYTDLKEAVSSFENISPDNVILGNGAIECIFLLAEYLDSKHTLLLAPTFVEYERAFSKYKSEISYYNLKEENKFELDMDDFIENLDKSIDTIVICNPNNPTGCVLKEERLFVLLAYCELNKITLIIDEAFVDFTDNEDEITMKKHLSECPNLIILKSLTKFFFFFLLRLGYLLTSNEILIEKIKSDRMPWMINCVASNIAIHSLKDCDYISATKRYILEQRRYLIEALKKIESITVYNSTANYIFMKCDKNLEKILSVYSIMVRNCNNYRNLTEGYYRIAVKTHDVNTKLIDILKENIK